MRADTIFSAERGQQLNIVTYTLCRTARDCDMHQRVKKSFGPLSFHA